EAINCASLRDYSVPPMGAQYGPAASTKNSRVSSRYRTQFQRAWRGSWRQTFKLSMLRANRRPVLGEHATPTPTSFTSPRADTLKTCAPMGSVRVSRCTTRHSKLTRDMHWPGRGWLKLTDAAYLGPTRCLQQCSSPPPSLCDTRSRSFQTWPKRGPNMPSGFIGS